MMMAKSFLRDVRKRNLVVGVSVLGLVAFMASVPYWVRTKAIK